MFYNILQFLCYLKYKSSDYTMLVYMVINMNMHID